MRKPSLRRKILLHVLWPLALTWALGAAIAIGLAQYFTMQAYDRALLDDAHALAAQVRSDSQSTNSVDAQGRSILSLSLTDAEMGAVLYDQTESIYFSVWRADGSLLAGHSGLRPLSSKGADDVSPTSLIQKGLPGAPLWRDGVYLGKDVRIVSIVRDAPARYTVVVAQTTTSRNEMLRRLSIWSLLPQLLLLAVLAWWLRRRVAKDLSPLTALRSAVERRDATDLQHIPESLAASAKTVDIEHLGLAVNSLFDRLQLGITAQREFSGNVAHELRTPLANIRLQAEHVLTNNADPAVQQGMKKLLASTDHASHLIDQLLALAFADEAENTAPLTPLNLGEVVRSVVLRHLPRADALKVDLGAEGLELPAQILGNRVLIEAALDNLIDNAFRYGLPAAGSLAPCRITVAVGVEGEVVTLRVIDGGVGLSPAEVERLKGRWAQANTKQTEMGHGVGLGLAIVSRYADLLHADFGLYPNPTGNPPSTGLCAQLTFKMAG
jgi:two-component system, OmpR family, sensor histidine kinase TctE